MFKVNNKDTKTTPMASFWCLYRLLWTYFTSYSSVSIVNFEQVNAGWGVFSGIFQKEVKYFTSTFFCCCCDLRVGEEDVNI